MWGSEEKSQLLLVEVRRWGQTDTTYQLGGVSSLCPSTVTWILPSAGVPFGMVKATPCSGDHGQCDTVTAKCVCNQNQPAKGFNYVEADCSGLQRPELPMNTITQIDNMRHCQDNFLSLDVKNNTYELVVDIKADI